jgi:hypothetical protein
MLMKITLLSILVVLFCAGTSFAQTQMIAHWPLDGNTQEVVNGKHGVPSPAGVSWVNDDPQRGQVMKLDGISGTVKLPSVLWTNPADTNTSITCWFNMKETDSLSVWMRVYSLGIADPAWKNMYLCPRDGWDDHQLHVTFHAFEPDQWYDYLGAWNNMDFDTVTPGKWYFTAVILKEDSLKIWVNDKLVTAEDSVYVTPQKIQAGDTSINVIGQSHWADPLFNGMIDDFRIYGDALTNAEVRALFDEGIVGTGNLVKELPINLYGQFGKIMYSNVDESSVTEVSVYSITGSLLFRTGKISELPSRSFNSGIYLVNVRQGQQLISRKVAVLQ